MGRVYPDNPLDLTSVAPYQRTVGHEVEYSSGTQLATLLDERGIGCPPHGGRVLHGYRCRCAERQDFLIHPTEDGTAGGGEYIIGGANGVVFGSDLYVEALQRFSDAATEVRNGVDTGVGMHTHVGTDDLTTPQKVSLLRNYMALENQIVDLAAMSLSQARSNGCVTPRLETSYYTRVPGFWTNDPSDIRVDLPSRPTLNFNGNGGNTVEFRIWNSTRADWRMYLAGGVSSAVVQATADGYMLHGVDEMDLLDFLDGYLTDDLAMLVQRQRSKNGG